VVRAERRRRRRVLGQACCGIATARALGLAVALLEAATVETRARIASVNNIAGLAMAGTWKNAVLAAATEVDSASPDANW